MNRNAELDAFRGLAVAIMVIVDAPPDFDAIYPILTHSPWYGLSVADLAFPGFVFAMGASVAFSQGRHFAGIWRRVLRRTCLLFLLGLAFNALPSFFSWLLITDFTGADFYRLSIAQGRVFGILQRLALTYALGTWLCLWLKSDARLLTVAFLLLVLSSTGFHLYAPEDPFGKAHNVSQAVDLAILGDAHVYHGYGFPFDPEGIYGTLASTSSMLLGVIGGRWILSSAVEKKIALLIFFGVALIVLGGLWSLIDPISKPLWTAPYALLTGGGSSLMLAVLVWLLEKKGGIRRLLQPLCAYGRNPLFFFLLTNIALMFLWTLPSPVTEVPMYIWVWRQTIAGFGGMAFSAALYAFLWCVLWCLPATFLYRRGVTIKL